MSLLPLTGESDEDFERFEILVGPNPDFEDGYSTEFCPALKRWTEEVAGLFNKSGCWWMIDYGFEAEEYFALSRKRERSAALTGIALTRIRFFAREKTTSPRT